MNNRRNDSDDLVLLGIAIAVIVVCLFVWKFMHRNFKMPMHQADAMTEASCLHSDA
ncbi:hypothetical protein ALO96_200108 [Pseudomonas savastanoi pv. glycinea]|nr:hypothetical protein ALO96_200108 [Pseudomonas savastanoi pv. glycinea]